MPVQPVLIYSRDWLVRLKQAYGAVRDQSTAIQRRAQIYPALQQKADTKSCAFKIENGLF